MRDLTVTTAASMTSREIADLVEKRHDNVKRTIESLVKGSVIVQPHSEDEQFTDAMGRSRVAQVYRFTGEQGKRDSIVVVAQLSPEFTASLVDRWQELEAKNAAPDLSTDVGKLLMIRDLAAKQLALVQENKHQDEKIESLESLFKEGMTATQFCKLLNGVNVMAINSCLYERNWLYNESKTGTRWRTASYARDRYLTEHQSEITPHGQEPFIKYTPVLLRKGAVRLHELYLAGELPMKKSWNGQFTHDKESLGVAV